MSDFITIDSTGISTKTYADIFAWVQDKYRSIYGTDIYIEADSQDGQFLAILALVIKDTCDTAVGVFNSFAPSKAQGAGLSSLVKINGLKKKSPTFSQVVVTLVGEVGKEIVGGVVSGLTASWSLPAVVTIPLTGQIDVTATCQIAGAIRADPGSITTIETPDPGWQTVTNAAAAIPGAPIELDAELRRRQAKSTAFPAETLREAIYARVAQVAGVTRSEVFQNDRAASDVNGLPPHSIAVVAGGGDLEAIATVVALSKNPGTGTFGKSSHIIYDSRGVPNTINVSALRLVPIYFKITIRALPSYVSTTGTLVLSAVAEYLNELDINAEIFPSRLAAPANLTGTAAMASAGTTQDQLDALSNTYVVQTIEIGLASDALAGASIPLAFDQAARGDSGNGTLVVV